MCMQDIKWGCCNSIQRTRLRRCDARHPCPPSDRYVLFQLFTSHAYLTTITEKLSGASRNAVSLPCSPSHTNTERVGLGICLVRFLKYDAEMRKYLLVSPIDQWWLDDYNNEDPIKRSSATYRQACEPTLHDRHAWYDAKAAYKRWQIVQGLRVSKGQFQK